VAGRSCAAIFALLYIGPNLSLNQTDTRCLLRDGEFALPEKFFYFAVPLNHPFTASQFRNNCGQPLAMSKDLATM
jgi:hypothetical protein